MYYKKKVDKQAEVYQPGGGYSVSARAIAFTTAGSKELGPKTVIRYIYSKKKLLQGFY